MAAGKHERITLALAGTPVTLGYMDVDPPYIAYSRHDDKNPSRNSERDFLRGQDYLNELIIQRIKADKRLQNCEMIQFPGFFNRETDPPSLVSHGLSVNNAAPGQLEAVKDIITQLNEEIPDVEALAELVRLKHWRQDAKLSAAQDQVAAKKDQQLTELAQPLADKIEDFYHQACGAYLSEEQRETFINIVKQECQKIQAGPRVR